MQIAEIKKRFQTRKINPAYVEFLASDFKENGFKNAYPVSITTDGVLWDGNHRVEAAIMAGLTDVPHIIEDPENMRFEAHERNRVSTNALLSKVPYKKIVEMPEILFQEGQYVWVNISDIVSTFAVRNENRAFVEFLKTSITSHGYHSTPCVSISQYGVLWDGNHRLIALKELGFDKIHAIISTPKNTRLAAHKENSTANNSLDSFFDASLPPFPGLEKEFEDSFCSKLEKEKINYQRQVKCVAGIADVVTDTHVYELKRHLTKSDIISAVGQVLLYRECIDPTAIAVIVGCEEKNTQDMIKYVNALGVEVMLWK